MIEHEPFENKVVVLCALYFNNKKQCFYRRMCVFSVIHGKMWTVNVYSATGTELYIRML